MKFKQIRIVLLTAAVGICALAGCGGGEYIPQAQQPTRRPEIGELRNSSAQPVSGEQGSISVDWELGTAPFRVVWTFSGGVEETVVWDTVNSRSYSLPVVWSNPGGDPEESFSCRLEISDVGNGYATKTFNFSVQP